MTTIRITSRPDTSRADHRKIDHVLALATGGPLPKRYGIAYVPPGASGRQVNQGPLVPGPWACTFELGVTLAADRSQSTGAVRRRQLAEGIEHDVTGGEQVLIDGHTFEVEVVKVFGRPQINLVGVEPDEPEAEVAALTHLIDAGLALNQIPQLAGRPCSETFHAAHLLAAELSPEQRRRACDNSSNPDEAHDVLGTKR